MRFAFQQFKFVIEPVAAVGIAAILNGRIGVRGNTIVTFVTGRNVDTGRFCALVNDK
ncbi:MAG: hypothetical protein KUG58_10335 [Marinosulfonomonas sp.]|nr:hypothetical protein [Marinosulfonomonas sp.]